MINDIKFIIEKYIANEGYKFPLFAKIVRNTLSTDNRKMLIKKALTKLEIPFVIDVSSDNIYVNGSLFPLKSFPKSFNRLCTYLKNSIKPLRLEFELHKDTFKYIFDNNKDVILSYDKYSLETFFCSKLKLPLSCHITNFDDLMETTNVDLCDCGFYKESSDSMCIPCEEVVCYRCGNNMEIVGYGLYDTEICSNCEDVSEDD